MPVRSQLFLAHFEEVVEDFGAVLDAFNEHWGTAFARFDHSPGNRDDCFRAIEDDWRREDGEIREMQVCRPSPKRRAVREALLEQAERSGFVQEELARAGELYQCLVRGAARAREVEHGSMQMAPGAMVA